MSRTILDYEPKGQRPKCAYPKCDREAVAIYEGIQLCDKHHMLAVEMKEVLDFYLWLNTARVKRHA